MRSGMFGRYGLDDWRAEVGEGPWSTEPDWAVWEHSSGLTCAVQRNSSATWCGYVFVTGHPINRGDLTRGEPAWLDCHGGVTWHGRMVIPEAELAGIAVGFDCNHSGDMSPRYPQYGGTYHHMEYAIAEANSLAGQIAAYAPLEQLISGTSEEV